MKQSEWKIIYTKYSGISKRAISFLSKEVGKLLIREPNVYRIHVLPCEMEGCAVSKNAFFIGVFDDSRIIPEYVSVDEVPKDGFLIKVIKNPADEEGRLVFITAHSEQELFYGAVSFVDDYIPNHAPECGSNRMADLFFDYPIEVDTYSEVPDNKTRSIFTWGHSINDYRAYIDNMARCKFNELVLWNDYIPINIKDIIDYAHSYGIKVVLGYSWGWKEIGNKVSEITDESIENVKKIAIREYRDNYSSVECDGIYFQSFTERKEDRVGGRLIADIVVDMVNDIASAIWDITPGLRLIFGLHATSVRTHLDSIARVDPRIELLSEDCGEFPYSYASFVKDEESFAETLDFTKQLLELRGGVGVGLVFKGVMMLDWTKFINQRGPYVMGENSSSVADHDRGIRAMAWRYYSSTWTQSGAKAQELLKYIKDNKLSNVNMCIAGTFDGGIYLPFAICAQLFRSCEGEYADILKRVMRRRCITVD